MNTRKWMTAAVAVFAASLAQAQGAGMNALWMKVQDKLTPVHEYSATMGVEAGGRAMSSKVFKSGQKMRTEIAAEGMQIVIIVDPETEDGKGVGYTLMPMMKMYTKLPLPPEAFTKADDDKMEVKVEELGKEDVGGQSCDKRRVTATEDGKTYTMLVWNSPAAKNMPVKIEVQDGPGGKAVITFKDYDFKKPAADLFTVPAGYQSNNMLQMMNAPRGQ